MTLLLSLVILFLGFTLLIKGADWLVDGASNLATRLGVSPFIIGLTVVAFGTSMPELVVNLFASIEGRTEIAIGNILGSNIANILLILGLSATVAPLAISRQTVLREIPLSALAALAVLIMVNDTALDFQTTNIISRTDGLLLLILFITSMYISFAGKRGDVEEFDKSQTTSLIKSHLYIFAGLIFLIFGGKLVVDSAIVLASAMNVSQAFIGLTVVAVGTSLPELFTSVIAAYRRQSDIAVGNVIGSNIFNILWIMGLSASISPLPFSSENNILLWVLLGATALVVIFLKIDKDHRLERWHGVSFVMLYILFIYITALGQ